MEKEKSNFNKTKYKNDFINENYDRINLTVPKGQKVIIIEHAQKHNEKLNTFIQRAIREAIERETNK